MTYKLKYVNDYGAEVEFGLDTGFIITGISGLSENFIEISTSQGLGQTGATSHGRSVLPKEVVINGEIVGEASLKKQSLLNAVLPGIPGRLIFNDEFYLVAEPKITPALERYTANCKFQFTLFAAYPYWRRIEIIEDIVVGARPLFKFPVNLQKSYKFSERTSETAARIHNPGNTDTRFKVVFTAVTPVLRPKIVKVSTKEFIKLNHYLDRDESVTVDTTGGNVLVYSDSNGIRTENIGYLDIDSELFTLSPGDNVIRYEAEINQGGLEVRMFFNETAVGVSS